MQAGRRATLAALALTTSLLAACAETPSPAEPQVRTVEGTASLSSCALAQDSVDALVPQLFVPGSERGFIASNYAKMNKELRLDRDAKALEYMWLLIDATLDDYYATPSRIVGGAASEKKVEDLVQGLLCLNGFDWTDASGRPLDLSATGGAAVVTGGVEATVTTQDKFAATKLPAGALPAGKTYLVTVAPIATPPLGGPLDTPLDQIGPFYEFSINPKVPFQVDVTTAICLNLPDNPADAQRVRLGHNRNPASTVPQPAGNIQFGNIEILALSSASGLGLNCATELGFFDRLLAKLAPKPLYAASFAAGTVGTGGKVREYSPFGGVDPGTLDYRSSDWLYLQPSTGEPAPAAAANFFTLSASQTAGVNGWAFGSAPFGDVRASVAATPGTSYATQCNGSGGTIDYGTVTIATPWMRATANSPASYTYLFARKVFHANNATDRIFLALDNDVRVWVDGVEVTASRQPASFGVDGTGFVLKEGCATADQLSFPVGSVGTHVVAVQARDRGVASYFDARAWTPPVIP